MRPNDNLIWAGAITLSLLMHLLLFVDSGSVAGVEAPPKVAKTRVTFRSVAAPQTPPSEIVQEEAKPPEKKVVETPPPPPKPKVEKARKPVEKVREVEKAQAKPPPEPPAETAPSSEVAQKPSLPEEAVAGSVADPALLEQAKHEYLRRLLAHIEAHKHYPNVARRRGIEGEVAVSFNLLSRGEVTDLKLEQGHRVLRQAVEEAIAAAHPMPLPPPELPLPMNISFRMQFALR